MNAKKREPIAIALSRGQFQNEAVWLWKTGVRIGTLHLGRVTYEKDPHQKRERDSPPSHGLLLVQPLCLNSQAQPDLPELRASLSLVRCLIHLTVLSCGAGVFRMSFELRNVHSFTSATGETEVLVKCFSGDHWRSPVAWSGSLAKSALQGRSLPESLFNAYRALHDCGPGKRPEFCFRET